MISEKIESKPIDEKETISDIETKAHHPTWEELCELFPDKYLLKDKPENYAPDTDLYVFEYGNKAIQIDLTDNPKNKRTYAMGHIQNQEQRKPIDNQTTYIFSAIKDKFKKIAIIEQVDIFYDFDTSTPTLAKWSITKGKEIFNWNKIDISIKRKGEKTFTKITEEELLEIDDLEKQTDGVRVMCRTIIKNENE